MPSLIELARMQQTAREKMPSLASVKRLSRSADGYGGETQIYTSIYENIPCRIDNLNQSELPLNGAIAEYKISLPAGTDVLATDRVEIEGNLYAVFGSVYKKSYEITRDIEVKRIG